MARFICSLILSALFLPYGAVSAEEVFCIGTVDGKTAEFGLVNETFKAYQRRYHKPVVFRVGETKLRHWPYIHPSTAE